METVLLTSGVLAAGYLTSKNYSRDYASVENNSKPFDDIYSSKIINPSVESNLVSSIIVMATKTFPIGGFIDAAF